MWAFYWPQDEALPFTVAASSGKRRRTHQSQRWRRSTDAAVEQTARSSRHSPPLSASWTVPPFPRAGSQYHPAMRCRWAHSMFGCGSRLSATVAAAAAAVPMPVAVRCASCPCPGNLSGNTWSFLDAAAGPRPIQRHAACPHPALSSHGSGRRAVRLHAMVGHSAGGYGSQHDSSAAGSQLWPFRSEEGQGQGDGADVQQ